MQEHEYITIYGHGLIQLHHQKNLLCIIISKNKLNDAQQDQEKEDMYEMIINLF